MTFSNEHHIFTHSYSFINGHTSLMFATKVVSGQILLLVLTTPNHSYPWTTPTPPPKFTFCTHSCGIPIGYNIIFPKIFYFDDLGVLVPLWTSLGRWSVMSEGGSTLQERSPMPTLLSTSVRYLFQVGEGYIHLSSTVTKPVTASEENVWEYWYFLYYCCLGSGILMLPLVFHSINQKCS